MVGWLFCCIAVVDCVLYGVKSAQRESGTELHIKILLYHDCDLMDVNINVMNKYSELC